MIALLAAASVAFSYNCTVAPPRAAKADGDKFIWKELGLPPEAEQWHFTVAVTGNGPPIAEVKWPADPIQSEGRFPVISTGKNAYSFVSFGAGPCLMTETSCIALFSIADQPDGTAKILVEPTALWSDDAKGTREPFIAKLEGQCTRVEAKR